MKKLRDIGLRRRILLLVSGISVVAVLLPWVLNEQVNGSALGEQMRRGALATVKFVAMGASRLAGAPETAQQLQDFLSSVAVLDPLVTRTILTDKVGTVVFDSNTDAEAGSSRAPLEIGGDPNVDNARAGGEPILRARAPVLARDELWGAVQIEYSLLPAGERAVSSLEVMIATCIVLWAGAFCAGLGLSAGITAPLKKIANSAQQVAAGNLQTRTGVLEESEIGATAATIDFMIGELATKRRQSEEHAAVLEERIGVRTQALEDLTKEIENLREGSPTGTRARSEKLAEVPSV